MLMNQRSGVFICLYVGYIVITYIRKSVSFASPSLMESENLDKSELGFILSSQMFGYSIGKLIGGIMVDIYSPSHVFAATLIFSASTVFAFTAFDSVAVFALCWFINGVSQGPSWPACAILIKKWFPPDKFGTWWSMLSTAMNVSGTTGPILSTFLLSYHSWRFTLNLAGSAAVAVAGMAFIMLADNPPSSVQKNKDEKPKDVKVDLISGVLDLLRQPVFVATGINYLLVSLVRGACTDWGHLYLIQDKQHSRLTGSSFISSQEVGGIIGSLIAGYASDFLISKKISSHNPRLVVVFFCTVVLSASVFLFMTAVSSTSSTLFISVIGFVLGFGVYGCVSMFGVLAMESAVDRLAGTAHSLVCLAANVGLMVSGYPLSLLAGHYGWRSAFIVVQVCAAATTIVALVSVQCITATIGSNKKKC